MKFLRDFSINKWFLSFLILYSADGISFFNHNVYPFALIIFLLLSLYWMIRNRIRINGFIKLMIPWIFYCTISFIYFEQIRPLFFVLIPISFFGVYVLIKSNYDLKKIFESYEKIVFFLAKISLLFYAWQLIDISSIISFFSLFDLNVGKSLNAIFYTIHFRSIESGIAQNCGFCWEPGPFSCFLCLALVIYLLKNKFKLDKRVLVYSITMLSTFSSTGYVCLMIIFSWFVFMNNKRYFLLSLPFALFIMYLFFIQSSVLGDKILDQMTEAEVGFEFYAEYGAEKQTSIGRFNGFLLNLKDFENYPILGHGGNFDATFSELNNLNITSTSGLGNWLAQYGIVGFLFLLISFYRSSFLIVNIFENKGHIFLFFIFLTITFSFSLITKSIFVLFFFCFYIDRVKILKENNYKIKTQF
tara:strand:- start:54 stop:1298 length:1245 start_codon:yes stop_codon:yes gene_type:complete